MNPVHPVNNNTTFGGTFAEELQERIAHYLPMEPVIKLGNSELLRNWSNVQYQAFKEMPLNSIFRTAIDRIDQAQPLWTTAQKVVHCIRSVNLNLKNGLGILSDRQLKSIQINRKDSIDKLTYRERINLSEMIEKTQAENFIRFFKDLAKQFPQMERFRTQTLNQESSPREQAEQMRQWMMNEYSNLFKWGEIIQLEEETKEFLLSNHRVPAEISILFHRFNLEFQYSLLLNICQKGNEELFERLLDKPFEFILDRSFVFVFLFSMSCMSSRFDFMEKCFKHPFFSTAVLTTGLMKEHGEFTAPNQIRIDLLQTIVEKVAILNSRSLKTILSFPVASLLSAPNIFNACLRSPSEDSLEIFGQSDLGKKLAPTQMMIKILLGSFGLTKEKLSALMGSFPKLRHNFYDLLIIYIDDWLDKFSDATDLCKKNYITSLSTFMETFPDLREVLKTKLQEYPEKTRLEEMSELVDLVESHKIAAQQQQEGDLFLMPSPAAQQRAFSQEEKKE